MPKFTKAEARHEEQRRDVWVRAWTSTANANDCREKDVATSWADTCLSEFDKRFKSFEVSDD
ncbi:hypothetical protein VPHD479_0383 [Vibrio phage D479]